MNDYSLFIYLLDCLATGYNLPQFCVDNEIKKPLFVAPNSSFWLLLREIHLQFYYDKRLSAQFAYVDGNFENALIGEYCRTVPQFHIKNISETNSIDFDRMIVLSATKISGAKPDTIYLDRLVHYCSMRSYAEIPLLHFLQKHPQIKLFVINLPILSNSPSNSAREKYLLEKNIFSSSLKNELDNDKSGNVKTPYDFLGYDNQAVRNLIEAPRVHVNADGTTSLENNPNNPFMGVSNGRRITVGQPSVYKNKIYFIGNCVYYGYGVPYDKTLTSCLQKMLNANNLPYRVENEAQLFGGRYQDLFYNLNSLPLSAGDIVFVNLQYLLTEKIPAIDVQNIFQRPHNYGEVFSDFEHLTELGHKALAENIFNFLVQNNFFQDTEFKYPIPPPPSIIGTGYRRKIFQPLKNFFKTKSWKNTKKSCVRKNFLSVA